MENLNQYGIIAPKILLPNKNINITQWAVIACDQYTQNTDYWEQVQAITQNVPSTFELILPEIYLDDTQRTEMIQSKMNEYIKTNVFAPEQESFIYVERTNSKGKIRKGLISAVDLETYDFKPFATSLIRSTEATIVERLPPRIKIRKKAILEVPHIILLVNDIHNLLIEKIGEIIKSTPSQNTPLYNAPLMLNGGHIKGYTATGDTITKTMHAAFKQLYKENRDSENSSFLFAAGDGNHSLATAKELWEQEKQNNPLDNKNSPLRYALVEIVNIYDSALDFEPIHRILFNVDVQKFMTFLENQQEFTIEKYDNSKILLQTIENSKQSCGILFENNVFKISSTHKNLFVSTLQPLIDNFLKSHQGNIDFIHGTDELLRLSKQKNTIAFFMPPIEKQNFFKTIVEKGPLPRKSFSLGEADDKRFYLECRKIIP